jgi:hypothetical protein
MATIRSSFVHLDILKKAKSARFGNGRHGSKTAGPWRANRPLAFAPHVRASAERLDLMAMSDDSAISPMTL